MERSSSNINNINNPFTNAAGFLSNNINNNNITNPFTNAAAGFLSNNTNKNSNTNNKNSDTNNKNNDTNNKNSDTNNKNNNLEKPYDPKWNTLKYKNRWEDPDYVKDLRYDMDWSN